MCGGAGPLPLNMYARVFIPTSDIPHPDPTSFRVDESCSESARVAASLHPLHMPHWQRQQRIGNTPIDQIDEADLGSFGGTGTEVEEEPLNWRQDPAVSLSDWQINVKEESAAGASPKTYHVHRNMLATGPRQSEYFVQLFRGGANSMREGSQRVSNLELKPTAASAFPLFLDFAYTGELAATTELACALLHLADYLGCRALHAETSQYIRDDLKKKLSACTYFFTEAKLYGLDNLSKLAFKMCAQNFGCLISSDTKGDGEEGGLFDHFPREDIEELLASPDFHCDSESLSIFVAQYGRGPHKDEIDATFLASLTNAEIMPTIDYSVAWKLLELAVKHDPPAKVSADCTEVQKTRLDERCIRVCVENYEDSLVEPILKEIEKESEELALFESQATKTAQRPKRRQTGAAGSSAQAQVARPPPRSLFPGSIPDQLKIRMLSLALLQATGQFRY